MAMVIITVAKVTSPVEQWQSLRKMKVWVNGWVKQTPYPHPGNPNPNPKANGELF